MDAQWLYDAFQEIKQELKPSDTYAEHWRFSELPEWLKLAYEKLNLAIREELKTELGE